MEKLTAEMKDDLLSQLKDTVDDEAIFQYVSVSGDPVIDTTKAIEKEKLRAAWNDLFEHAVEVAGVETDWKESVPKRSGVELCKTHESLRSDVHHIFETALLHVAEKKLGFFTRLSLFCNWRVKINLC